MSKSAECLVLTFDSIQQKHTNVGACYKVLLNAHVVADPAAMEAWNRIHQRIVQEGITLYAGRSVQDEMITALRVEVRTLEEKCAEWARAYAQLEQESRALHDVLGI